jgi:hypothetical protein
MALDAIEQLLVANHGFTVTPEGAVVSPSGQVRNVVDGKTTFTPYTPPTTGPTFAEQFAAQQAQAIAQTNQVRQDEAIASGQDTYQSVATDGSGAVTDVSVGTPAAIQPLPPADFMPGLPSAPTQTREELESALAEASDLGIGTGARYKNRESDLTGVTYTDKTAYEYDLGEEYDNVVAVRSGNSLKFYKDGERLDRDEASDALGIDVLSINSLDSGNDKIRALKNQLRDQEIQGVYDQFGGEEGALVSEYLADEAAAAKRRADSDEASDERMFGTIDTDPTSDTYLQRTGGTMQALNEQVQREADALGISADEFRSLGFPLRAQMAISDIGELFGETNIVPSSDYGGLLGAYNPTNVSSGLGTLGSENLAIYQDKAQDRLDELTPYDPATMDPYSEADRGGQFDYTKFNLGPSSMPVAGGVAPVKSDNNKDEFFSGFDDYSIFGVPIGPSDPVGPGAGSNTGGGAPAGGSGGDADDDPLVDDPTGGGDTGTNIGVIDPIGGGGGLPGQGGGGTSPTGLRESAYGLTLDDILVPSTVNYGTDPRFANLAPKFKVSEAAMPVFNRLGPATTSLLAEGGEAVTPELPPAGTDIRSIPIDVLLDPRSVIHGVSDREGKIEILKSMGIIQTAFSGGIVSLAGGGTPKGEGITPDFMIDYYNKSLIPKALDGNEAARKAVLEAHSNFSNFTLPEELLLKIKYGRANGGVASLSDTARNMFRPMVG